MNNSLFKASKSIILLFLCFFWGKAESQDNILDRKQKDSVVLNLPNSKTDYARLNSLVDLGWFHVLKPGELKPDLDSARSYLAQAAVLLKRVHSDQLTGYYDLVISEYYNESGEKKKANEALEKAIPLLISGKNKFLLGSAYLEKMYRIPLSPDHIDEKISLVQQAEAAFAVTTYKRKLGDCLKLLGDLHSINKNDIRVLPELDSAKRFYEQAKSGDWQQLYLIYARYYDRESDSESALKSVLSALKTTESNDNAIASQLNMYAASLFLKMKEYNKCIEYCKKALLYVEKTRDLPSIYNALYFYVIASDKRGTLKDCLPILNNVEAKYPDGKPTYQYYHLTTGIYLYTKLRQFEKGKFYFKLLEDQLDKNVITINSFRYNSLTKMIIFCTTFKQFKKADKLFNDWKIISKTMPSLRVKSQNLQLQLGLDTAKKKYHSAVHDLLQLKVLDDSIFSETRTKKLQELEIRYQIERKENENSLQKQKILFLTRQHKFQEAELKSAGFAKNITLTITFCLFIIVGLIYWQYIIGRKNNLLIGEKNSKLQQLLGENEWLMKEMHHRVKNNLQIITALLNSQSAYLDKGAAKDAILKSKGRVESISLIHQKLYVNENHSMILMPEYVKDLIGYLKDSLLNDQQIEFDLSIADIHMDVADAVPIGLIINESITNSIKHAFTDQKGNAIGVEIKIHDSNICLTIRDNGRGFVVNQFAENPSFGILLINGLCEDLNGKLEMYNDGGTVIRIHFRPTVSSNV